MLLTKYQNTDSVPGPEADLIRFLVSQRLKETGDGRSVIGSGLL
jgi:hypothetical protein